MAKERKPTLSPSKITSYLACPLKYRWTYVDARGKLYLRARSYYSFGTTLHRVLERFHDANDVGVETTHEALVAYEESWLEAGFSSAEEMADAFGEGQAILERYIEGDQISRASRNTILVEKLLRLDMGDFDLVGRVDRVDEHEDGTLEIVDYKTGRQTVTTEDVATDVAMSCYQLLVRAEFPGRPVKATIVSLRSGESATYAMSDDEISEFRFIVSEIGQRIFSHDYYELVPVFKATCRTCDFIPLCRKHHEYEEPVPTFEDAP